MLDYSFLKSEFPALEVIENEPMSRHTTFRIGGPADVLVTVNTKGEITKLVKRLRELNVPYLILGNGSNLLVSDEGIRGVVVAMGGELKSLRLLDDGITVRAGAGATLASLCTFARDNELTGLEFAWGIPGTVGGAVYMNAGAYGGEIKDVVASADSMDCGKINSAELAFEYRRSRFSGTDDVILSADFKLQKGDITEITAKMDEKMTRRKNKQPYDMPSAGSVFKRPVNGYAAALIEECGLKGRTVGGAQVSEKHAGFIVNIGGATCKDVVDLADLVSREVFEKKGIMLEREVIVIGGDK